MEVYIYCFDKGFFKKKKFMKDLKTTLANEFKEFKKETYVLLDKLTFNLDKSYSSYFTVYEQSNDLDRMIDALSGLSDNYTLHLSCTLREQTESDVVNYMREQVKGRNITVSASIRI